MYSGMALKDLMKSDGTPTIRNDEIKQSTKPNQLVKSVVPESRIEKMIVSIIESEEWISVSSLDDATAKDKKSPIIC